MAILVLGGAGYIGSHMVKQLVGEGREVVVVDNLSTGHREALDSRARFYECDCRDKAALEKVFAAEDITTVMHFASFSVVPESVRDPLRYFDNNVISAIVLLEVMVAHDVKQVIFSSTAATYGQPEIIPIVENTQQSPINPYGDSKLMIERLLTAADHAYGIRSFILRYFNVAGASADGTIGEDHTPETHLIPIVLQVALGQRDHIDMMGNDYDTPDGFNVRDYLHVDDLISAHSLALNYLEDGGKSEQVNLGSSTGFSVQEIVAAAREATGHPIPSRIAPRRGGDPDILVADANKARQILGWVPQYDDIVAIISSAWRWHESHPNGYKSK